jgi:hypothetical protein
MQQWTISRPEVQINVALLILGENAFLLRNVICETVISMTSVVKT